MVGQQSAAGRSAWSRCERAGRSPGGSGSQRPTASGRRWLRRVDSSRSRSSSLEAFKSRHGTQALMAIGSTSVRVRIVRSLARYRCRGGGDRGPHRIAEDVDPLVWVCADCPEARESGSEHSPPDGDEGSGEEGRTLPRAQAGSGRPQPGALDDDDTRGELLGQACEQSVLEGLQPSAAPHECDAQAFGVVVSDGTPLESLADAFSGCSRVVHRPAVRGLVAM